VNHKVLVVDDDPQILRTLRINLSAHGYRVVLAPDGAAALRAAADEQPDVIVLDLGLPGSRSSLRRSWATYTRR